MPLSLTSSDGAGLTLVSLQARAVVEDPLALTELHLTFHNPESRQREGRFELTLPPGAVVSRFATRQSGGWQEGEVGMGKLEVVEHDGQGNLRFDERLFVIMTDSAFIELGTIKGPLSAK